MDPRRPSPHGSCYRYASWAEQHSPSWRPACPRPCLPPPGTCSLGSHQNRYSLPFPHTPLSYTQPECASPQATTSPSVRERTAPLQPLPPAEPRNRHHMEIKDSVSWADPGPAAQPAHPLALGIRGPHATRAFPAGHRGTREGQQATLGASWSPPLPCPAQILASASASPSGTVPPRLGPEQSLQQQPPPPPPPPLPAGPRKHPGTAF